MPQWLKQLRERWENWTGDRQMELAIRSALSRQGYFGRTAQLKGVRLVAIQRPGWVQVYRFEVRARVATRADENGPDPAAKYDHLFGLVRDDARHRTDVQVFENEADRRELFHQWSEGLLCLRGAHGLLNPPSPS